MRRREGHLALEDLRLIGDGTTSARVGLDGSIPWLCLPRFDSEPLFCGSAEVIDRLVIFCGTGDLMGRYLLPGLAALRSRGHLPERFELVAASRQDWDDEQFRVSTSRSPRPCSRLRSRR